MAVQKRLLFWHMLLKQFSVETIYITIEWNLRQLVLIHHFNITNNYTLKMEQTFPNKHQSLWVCSSGALYARYGWLCRDCCYFGICYKNNSLSK